MKTLVKILGVIVLILVIVAGYLYIADPFNIKSFLSSSDGIDTEELLSKITPEMEQCFIEKLGEERVNEIVEGDSPTAADLFKARSCLTMTSVIPAPIAEWTFDECAGDTAKDSFSNNDGIVYGASWEDAYISNGLHFDGSDDYVIVSDAPSIKIAPDDFSVSAYVYVDEMTGGWQTIVEYDRGSNSGEHKSWFGIWINPEGKAHFRVGHGPQESTYDWASTINSNKTLRTGRWYLITATYDTDSDEAVIYIDKNQGASTILSITSFWSAPLVADLTIGASKWDSGIKEHFNGTIDEVKVWDEILSSDDVRELAARKKRFSNCVTEVAAS